MGDRRGAASQEAVSGRGGVPRREWGSQPEEPGEKARRPGWSRGLQGGETPDSHAGRGLALSSLQTHLKSPGTAGATAARTPGGWPGPQHRGAARTRCPFRGLHARSPLLPSWLLTLGGSQQPPLFQEGFLTAWCPGFSCVTFRSLQRNIWLRCAMSYAGSVSRANRLAQLSINTRLLLSYPRSGQLNDRPGAEASWFPLG